MRAWVEETDSTGAKLGEPQVAIPIQDQVKGRTAFPQVPLLPALVVRIKFTQRITAGLGKPDLPIAIDHHKQGAGVSPWLGEIGNEGAVGESVLAQNARHG